MESFESFLKKVPHIEETKNYWFLRTMRGHLFSPFLRSSIIAIDYANIDEENANSLIKGKLNEAKIKFIQSKYPDHKKPSIIVNNLKRFYSEMKIGDYVVIPDIPDIAERSIAVGEIISEIEYIEGIEMFRPSGKAYIDREYQRSRKVKWLALAKKNNFSPYLYGLLNSHLTISKANAYSEWIDGLMFNFYKKNEQYHYIINIKQRYGLSAKTVYGAFYELLNLADEFLREERIDESVDSIDTKIALRSPGFIELLGMAGTAITIICFLILFINGGGFKYKKKDGTEISLSTDGVIKRLNEFLNSRKDRIIKSELAVKIKSLKIENTDDIVDILNTVNEKNQNE